VDADEDDAAMMPAPSMDYLAQRPHHPAPPVRSPQRAVLFRRTVIPILLTSGVLMLVAAGLKYVVDPDAPLAVMPLWMSVVLALAGVALLVVAGLNVVQARH
jgi:hypothetical protein